MILAIRPVAGAPRGAFGRDGFPGRAGVPLT
jgi:hypothetical protein